MAPTKRGFSVLGVGVSSAKDGCQRAMRVRLWKGSSKDSVKNTGGYDTGSVRLRIRLNEGVSSFVSGTSSTFAGSGGVVNMGAIGRFGTGLITRSSTSSGVPFNGDVTCWVCCICDIGKVSEAGIDWSAFVTAAGFFNHAVIEDWSMAGACNLWS